MMKLFRFMLKADANHSFTYVVMEETLPKAFQKLRGYFMEKYQKDLMMNDIHNMVELENGIDESFC